MAATETAYETLNKILSFQDSDAQFWWDRTGRMFAKLIEQAGYSPAEQYRELLFYALFVAPAHGPAPDLSTVPWDKMGLPDWTPIDFSWDWGSAIVRYAFEPIPVRGETKLDTNPTDLWLEKLQSQNMIPGLNLEWYKHFAATMLPSDINRKGHEGDFYGRTAPKFGTAAALDVNKTGSVVKMYFWPTIKAAEDGISNLQCVKQSIRALPTKHLGALNAEPLLQYLDEATERWGLETGIVSIDCNRPQESRIKIYVRAPYTTKEFLMDALTMGGRLTVTEDNALASLQALWETFLADAPDKLEPKAAMRSSPGFYYTLGYGVDNSVKMYLAPHYLCKSDSEVLLRLRQYSAKQEKPQDMMDKYESAVYSVFDTKVLDGRCASHFYIGCALHKGQARMVTYMSPQVFLLTRDQMKIDNPSIEEAEDNSQNDVINGNS
ncbi:aromatic prenyltransferase [Polychaeton citri CBS 116435]|uniref:Aromatic prenyltransferase n=1 Tax=Polychaeton citri CBS 116435 TaxID=1314669 RepID=A0A9P4UUP5_9PEZI|nr:aromatic prenyltransferase [Polychaeton citri CBS 116435]